MKATDKYEIKTVQMQHGKMVCGKFHAAIYGEYTKLKSGKWLIYNASTEEVKEFDGTEQQIREYFRTLAYFAMINK